MFVTLKKLLKKNETMSNETFFKKKKQFSKNETVCFYFVANYANPRRQRKPSKKPKQRPLFSQTQLKQLEEEFVNEKYISKSRRMKLAKEINLTEAQVRTWFQNRRTRWRKEIHGNNGSQCCESSPWKPNCAPQEVTVERSTPTNFMVVRGFCIS